MTNKGREEIVLFLSFWRTCPKIKGRKVDPATFLQFFCQMSISGSESVKIGMLNLHREGEGPGINCSEESMICGLCPVYQRFK